MSALPSLTQLILPVNLCIALLAVAVVLALLRWRRLAGLFAALGLSWVLAWSLPVTSLWLGGALEQRYPYLPPEQVPKADAIVVLGGHTANNRENWFLPFDPARTVPRIERAAELYKAGRAPLIVLSGGALEGPVSEAQGMAHVLQNMGVPAHALLLENASRNTYENAALTADELRERGIEHVLLVTSALHMPRAMAAFGKQTGARVTAAPQRPQITRPAAGGPPLWLPDWRTLDASRSIIKEYAGLFVYWLRGWV